MIHFLVHFLCQKLIETLFVEVVNNNVFLCYCCSFRRYGFSRQAGKTEQVKIELILKIHIVGRIALVLLECW